MLRMNLGRAWRKEASSPQPSPPKEEREKIGVYQVPGRKAWFGMLRLPTNWILRPLVAQASHLRVRRASLPGIFLNHWALSTAHFFRKLAVTSALLRVRKTRQTGWHAQQGRGRPGSSRATRRSPLPPRRKADQPACGREG